MRTALSALRIMVSLSCGASRRVFMRPSRGRMEVQTPFPQIRSELLVTVCEFLRERKNKALLHGPELRHKLNDASTTLRKNRVLYIAAHHSHNAADLPPMPEAQNGRDRRRTHHQLHR